MPRMKQEDVELNKARVQIVRSQLKEFSQTLREIEPELTRPDLRQRINEHSAAIQVIRDKLSGVENFLALLLAAA